MHLNKNIIISLISICLLSFSLIAKTPEDIRVALVIGNATYKKVPALSNSKNDSKAIAILLKNLGFTVVEIEDGNKEQMDEGLKQLNLLIKGKEAIGLLYYAGHGIQVDWKNYMIPVDFDATNTGDVGKQAVDVQNVIKVFQENKTRSNIIILDACRDNPFSAKTNLKGLAPVDAPPGTYLAYATAPGNVAEDGDELSGNGLFTKYLIEELQIPAKIEDVFKRVRLQVRKKSEGRQIPWDSSSLEDDFYFNDGKFHSLNPESVSRQIASIKNTGKTIEDKSPEKKVDEVKQQISLALQDKILTEDQRFEREKIAWDKIKESKNVNDFYAFLLQFPNGFISQEASFKLNQLENAKVISQANRNEVQQDPNQVRYRIGDTFSGHRLDYFTGNEIDSYKGGGIKEIKDGKVFFKGGTILSDSGAVIQLRRPGGWINKYDPPLASLPLELQVGMKWEDRSYVISSRNNPEFDPSKGYFIKQSKKVVAFEEIKIPAGTFKAYKIELNYSDPGTSGVIYQWYAPNIPYTLKTIRNLRNNRGQPIDYDIQELTSLQLAARN
jgi:Caspase domain